MKEVLAASSRIAADDICTMKNSGLFGAIAWPIGEKGSPFRGLEAFGPADEEIFFGRERETARALERLSRAAARGCGFLLLVSLLLA